MTVGSKIMKKLTRTTMTWRFVNAMAPAQQNHMPTKVCKAKLIEVTAAMFRGKATLTVWFEAMNFVAETHRDVVRGAFGREFRKFTEELDVKLNYGDDEYSTGNPVWMNGPGLTVDLTFDLKNGESFTHTAMQKFVKLVILIGQEEWRKNYYLPMPQIVQETMVEAYCKDNWATYGEYLYAYQPFDPLGPRTEFEKEIQKDLEAQEKPFR